MTTTTLLFAPSAALLLALFAPAPQSATQTGLAHQHDPPSIRPQMTITQPPVTPGQFTPPMIRPQVSIQKPPVTPTQYPGFGQDKPPILHFKGEAVSYCESAVNSSGVAAWMDCAGDLSVCHNNTCLVAEGCPAGTIGVFFYGGGETQVPMGNGYLCVAPFQPALFRLPPVAAVTASGRAEMQLDVNTVPQAGAITPGATWYFQFWFRDANAGGAGTNLSDGLRITFCN